MAQKANLSFKKIPYIPITDETSDFKFGLQLEFDNAHHKIIPRGKSGCGLGLGELPKILGFPYNISAVAEASDFKFGTQFGFAKAHHKNSPGGKVGKYFCNGRSVILALAKFLVLFCFV